MRPTQDLVTEHEAVLLALRILERVEDALGTGREEAAGDLDRLLEFLTGFVDRCHHGKEEDVLFPEMTRRGVPREGGPIGVMLAEHELGRGRIRAMAEARQRMRGGAPGAAAAVRENAAAYRDLMVIHISKENGVLFPMADRLLAADAASLQERFDAIERDRVGPGKHEAYHALLHELQERYGVS